jgi:hypothetical protein
MSNELIQYVCQWIILVLQILQLVFSVCKQANTHELPHIKNAGIIGVIIGFILINLCLWTAGAYSLIF